jgi:hypothetical protein
MKLFFDLRIDRLVAAPGQDSVITGLAGKSGDGATPVQLIFGRSSDPTSTTSIVEAPTWTPENLPGGTVIRIGIKEDGEYSDGTLLASNSTWTHNAGTYTYTGSLDLNTNEIDTALNRDDANAGNDVASLACSFELTYQPSGSGGWRSSVEPVEFTIYHDILVGDEATPTNAGDPTQYLLKASGIEWLPTVTSQTGGTAADLDAIATVGVTVGKLVMFKDADTSDLLRTYQLTAGTDAESAPAVIRPDDYNASTNAKFWKQRQIDGESLLPSTVSQAEAEAGTATTNRLWTAERVKQSIAALESTKGLGSSVANEVVLFNGTDGRQLKRATTTGIAKLTSGVLSAATAGTDYASAGAITSSGLTMATARLLGRTTASTGSPEEITIGANLSMTAGTLSATGIDGLPIGTIQLTVDTSLLYGTHDKNYIEGVGSISTITISAQASSSWAANSHFWIVNRKSSGNLTIAAASGVSLIYAGSSAGNITLSHTDRPVHIWRSASDVWRVIS